MHVKMMTADYMTTKTVAQKSSFHYLPDYMCTLCAIVHNETQKVVCGNSAVSVRGVHIQNHTVRQV
jgi:hypothetical protein